MSLSDDDADFYPDYDGYNDECEHVEYEVDFDGRAHCDRCSHSWWLSAQELQHHLEREAEFSGQYDAMLAREDNFWLQLWDRIKGRWWAFRHLRQRHIITTDDGIPF